MKELLPRAVLTAVQFVMKHPGCDYCRGGQEEIITADVLLQRLCSVPDVLYKGDEERATGSHYWRVLTSRPLLGMQAMLFCRPVATTWLFTWS